MTIQKKIGAITIHVATQIASFKNIAVFYNGLKIFKAFVKVNIGPIITLY